MNSSFRLARIFGIPVEIHISWLLVLVLFTYLLARGYFPGEVPGLGNELYWVIGLTTAVVAFASILAHELAHSLIAIREGISIKKIVLFIFGGVAQMEAEPGRPLAELKIAAAGPLTSLLIGVLLGAFYFLFLPREGIASAAIYFLARLNIIVAIFNLLPAFPLDGGRLFRAAVWHFYKNLLRATRIAVGIGSFLAFLIMGTGFLWLFFGGSLSGIWLIFLGWMIYQAGRSSYSQLVFRETFAGIKVGEIMSGQPQTVSPDLKLQELADYFFQYKFGAFPVVYGSTTHGLVSLHQLKEVPRDKWADTSLSRVMTPLKDCLVTSPQADAADLMMKMASQNEGRALVMDGGELVGILSRTDMMRFMKMHMILGGE